jgi:hypothetical protein
MHAPDARVPVDEAPRGFGCAMAAREEREGTGVNGGGDCVWLVRTEWTDAMPPAIILCI